jgi:hypothetical protein
MTKAFFIKLILVVCSSILTSGSTIACICSEWTEKFIDELWKADFIAVLEIIDRDTLKNYEFEENFTRGRIVNQLKGPKLENEIFIYEAHPFSCNHNISYAIGKTVLVKGYLKPRQSYEFDMIRVGVKKGLRSKVLELSICEKSIVMVENEMAIGHITVDAHKKVNPNEDEVIYNEMEKMPINEVIRIVKNNLRKRTKIPRTQDNTKLFHG